MEDRVAQKGVMREKKRAPVKVPTFLGN